MTQAEADFAPLHPDRHAGQGWAPPRELSRFAGEILAPALLAELPALIPTHPLAFARVSQTRWGVMALMGLHPGRNLFLTPQGRWRADYVPSALRGHPFAVAPGAEGEAAALCFDMSSGLLRPRPDPAAGEEPFFGPDGAPSAALARVRDFLSQAAADARRTQAAVDALAAEDLFVPWTPKVANPEPETPFQPGLHRVDAARLAALSGEALARLQASGALLLAHAQMLSSGRTGLLARAARAGTAPAAVAAAGSEAGAAPTPDPSVLFGEDDMFDFGNGG